MKILMVCERSGGHIFPALGLAQGFKNHFSKGPIHTLLGTSGSAPTNKIIFFSTAEKLTEYITKEGYKTVGRCFNRRNIFVEIFWRFFEAFKILNDVRPDLVIGFGGRDSLFLVLFASALNLKTAIYEPNRYMGKANKLLSFFVKDVYAGFPCVPKGYKKAKVVGIPLRKNITKIDKAQAKRSLGFNQQPVIFCFGGSQGSAFLNQIFLKLAGDLGSTFQIIHLTGRKQYVEISSQYNKIKTNKYVAEFDFQIERLYSACDIVISRAGASTLAEIDYYQVPAILIAHPTAGGHQKANLSFFKEKGAVFSFEEKNFSYTAFKDTVKMMISDPILRKELAENLSQIPLGVKVDEFTKIFIKDLIKG